MECVLLVSIDNDTNAQEIIHCKEKIKSEFL